MTTIEYRHNFLDFNSKESMLRDLLWGLELVVEDHELYHDIKQACHYLILSDEPDLTPCEANHLYECFMIHLYGLDYPRNMPMDEFDFDVEIQSHVCDRIDALSPEAKRSSHCLIQCKSIPTDGVLIRHVRKYLSDSVGNRVLAKKLRSIESILMDAQFLLFNENMLNEKTSDEEISDDDVLGEKMSYELYGSLHEILWGSPHKYIYKCQRVDRLVLECFKK
jgi:hypothetical protein